MRTFLPELTKAILNVDPNVISNHWIKALEYFCQAERYQDSVSMVYRAFVGKDWLGRELARYLLSHFANLVPLARNPVSPIVAALAISPLMSILLCARPESRWRATQSTHPRIKFGYLHSGSLSTRSSSSLQRFRNCFLLDYREGSASSFWTFAVWWSTP